MPATQFNDDNDLIISLVPLLGLVMGMGLAMY